ncbi:MAG: hypothetical protein HS116_09430 [Planctomycetes bacterium]|nr:hypothetical protein [Planctomycetota bacterium]
MFHPTFPDPQSGLNSNFGAKPGEPVKRSEDLARLEHDVERLLMISEALWEILKQHHGYSDDDLMRRVAQIDLKDGKLDGKVAKTQPVQCPRCTRTINRRHSICIYCGEQIVQHPFQR